MGFIDKAGLLRIQQHKYVSGSYTIIDNLMQPFWNRVARFIPHSIAPNMVTLIGFVIMIWAAMVYLHHDTSQS